MEETMTTFSRAFSKQFANTLHTTIGERFGGHLGRPNSTLTTDEGNRKGGGSHMPLDTGMHWDWANPLNILPALVLLVIVIDVLGLILA
jgi:hypothetical protein